MLSASRDGLMVVNQPRQPAKKFLGKVVKRCGRHGSQGDNQTGIRPSRDLFTGGHFVFCFRAFPRNGRCANIAGLFDRSLSAWAAPTRRPRSGQQTTGSRGSCSSSSGSKWTARSPNASPPASKLWPSSWSRRGRRKDPCSSKRGNRAGAFAIRGAGCGRKLEPQGTLFRIAGPGHSVRSR